VTNWDVQTISYGHCKENSNLMSSWLGVILALCVLIFSNCNNFIKNTFSFGMQAHFFMIFKFKNKDINITQFEHVHNSFID
jgi:hypothetical protein